MDIARFVTDIFNFSLETEVFPDDSKVGRVGNKSVWWGKLSQMTFLCVE